MIKAVLNLLNAYLVLKAIFSPFPPKKGFLPVKNGVSWHSFTDTRQTDLINIVLSASYWFYNPYCLYLSCLESWPCVSKECFDAVCGICP